MKVTDMSMKHIAINIVVEAAPFFATSKDKWEDTCYEAVLPDAAYPGYSIVIWGERRVDNAAFWSVNIRETAKVEEPGSVVPVVYTEDANVLSLRDAIAKVLGRLHRLVNPKTNKSRAKYHKGGHILSMDEFVKQEFVYLNDKITHRGWFMSWQMSMVYRMLGENGRIFYAIKNRPDKIVCNKCGRRFTGSDELKKFVEVQVDVDGIYTLDYKIGMDLDEKCEIFRGCPHCRTDAYLMDLDEE